MEIGRREFMAGAIGVAVTESTGDAQGAQAMHGLISKVTAMAGQREAVIAILLEGIAIMPGCLSYVIAKDAADADAIWITEVWENRASHDASLSLPAVQAAIARARPSIAGFGDRVVTIPVGGHGLTAQVR